MNVFGGAIRKLYNEVIEGKEELIKEISSLETEKTSLNSQVSKNDSYVNSIFTALTNLGLSIASSDKIITKIANIITNNTVKKITCQSGSKTIWAEQNKVYTGTIKFPTAFSGKPNVWVHSNENDFRNCSASNISATGFTYSVTAPSNGNNYSFNWFAEL